MKPGDLVKVGKESSIIYFVREIQTSDTGITIPKSISGYDEDSKQLNSFIIRDSSWAWLDYTWIVVEPLVVKSKQELIIDKIKYLDLKFKMKQSEKETVNDISSWINNYEEVRG
jgi:hypothetical protein